MKRLTFVLALVLGLLLPQVVFAVEPHEVLADPALETRAREISTELRCLVCQNQSIDDSDAELAADLRVLVRERLVAGDNNEEVLQYIVDRYGEYVLLNPVLGLHTLVLWVATPLVLVIGMLVLFTRMRRRAVGSSSEMTDAERAVLKDLTRDTKDAKH